MSGRVVRKMNELLEKYPIRNPDTAFSKVEEEAVIVEPEDGLINVLNPVGARIWELADGSKRLCEIVKIIYSEFDVEQRQAQNDAIEFIFDLVDKELILLRDTSAM